MSHENFIKWVYNKDYEANELKVKELRQITGCDIMSCRKALAQSDWDIEKAVKWFGEVSILTTAPVRIYT